MQGGYELASVSAASPTTGGAVVVNTAPKAWPRWGNRWSHDGLDVCGEPGGCPLYCYANCCPCCAAGDVAAAGGASWCNTCCCFAFLAFVPCGSACTAACITAPNRAALAARYSVVDDRPGCCWSYCCPFNNLVQELHHVRASELGLVPPFAGGGGDGPATVVVTSPAAAAAQQQHMAAAPPPAGGGASVQQHQQQQQPMGSPPTQTLQQPPPPPSQQQQPQDGARFASAPQMAYPAGGLYNPGVLQPQYALPYYAVQGAPPAFVVPQPPLQAPPQQ